MVEHLDRLYNKYNNIDYIHPDPYEFVLRYKDKKDQEVVGLIAASFAIGSVFQILKFLESVFKTMGDSPYNYLLNSTPLQIEEDFNGFYYRYFKDIHITEFFNGISRALNEYNSLEDFVLTLIKDEDEDYGPLFKRFSQYFNLGSALIPKSSGNSAFKRLALYFRWMVRKDAVDIGIWSKLEQKKLILPLDIHMTNISKILGFTKSSTNSMSNALKITKEFGKLNPDDPVKWDFALSRLGIHPDLDYNELIKLF